MDVFPSRKSLAHVPRSGKLKTSSTFSKETAVAKRPDHRAIRSARSYTIHEAADTLGVSIGTVRG